jgi:Zn-dependent protease with chaperone function
MAHFQLGDTRLRVFFSRFLESLRRSARPVRRSWWTWIDPVCWFCRAYLCLSLYLSAPIRRHQELRADMVSADAYGGELAARTLLKEWLLTRQFEAAVEAYAVQLPGSHQEPTTDVFRWFAARWHDFSPEGHNYLLRRLTEVEPSSIFDSHPPIAKRIGVMRGFRNQEPIEPLPARQLLHDFAGLADQLHRRLVVCQGVPCDPPT